MTSWILHNSVYCIVKLLTFVCFWTDFVGYISAFNALSIFLVYNKQWHPCFIFFFFLPFSQRQSCPSSRHPQSVVYGLGCFFNFPRGLRTYIRNSRPTHRLREIKYIHMDIQTPWHTLILLIFHTCAHFILKIFRNRATINLSLIKKKKHNLITIDKSYRNTHIHTHTHIRRLIPEGNLSRARVQ